MDSGGDTQGTQPGATLRPEPIPANVKAILIGDLSTYRPLMEQDPEFRLLFKVRADFDDEMQRTPESRTGLRPLCRECRAHQWWAVTGSGRGGAGSSRKAAAGRSDQERLSTVFGSLRDLTMEACYWAKKDQAETTIGDACEAVQSPRANGVRVWPTTSTTS